MQDRKYIIEKFQAILTAVVIYRMRLGIVLMEAPLNSPSNNYMPPQSQQTISKVTKENIYYIRTIILQSLKYNLYL